MRRILVAVGIVVLLFTMVMSCERIDAGHVGVKVDMYGSGKGVNDVTECTGVVFYNPITTKIMNSQLRLYHYHQKENVTLRGIH
jgi:hypothetical protein